MTCWSVFVRKVYISCSIGDGEGGWIMMICWSVSVRRVYLFVSVSVAVSTGGCIFFFLSFLSASGQWLGLYQILFGGGGGGGGGGWMQAVCLVFLLFIKYFLSASGQWLGLYQILGGWWVGRGWRWGFVWMQAGTAGQEQETCLLSLSWVCERQESTVSRCRHRIRCSGRPS